MADRFAGLVAGLVDHVVRWVVLPVTGVIPWLVSSGLLFLAFAVLWGVFGAALLVNPSSLDEASRWLGGLHVGVQALAWLLFLPLTAGLWVFGSGWPLALRLVVIAGLAGWTLLVLFPRRPAPAEQAAAMGGM